MIELDGKQYIVSTPSQNTKDMLDSINTYCNNNNVKNSKDEIIHIEENFASPIYLILWALGYLVTIIQNLIFCVAKGLNVQSASDDQLLNLADMSGVKRGQPSVTTFNLAVQCMSTDASGYDPNANDGQCIITSEDTITYQGVVYKPALHPNIVIAPGQWGYITMVAQTTTTQQIAANTIQQFDTTIANLATVRQDYAATPGQSQESIASLRDRIQRRQYSGTTIDSAIDAIRALPGVTICNIIYNESSALTITVGEDALQILPRHALIIVQGYNANIAAEYAKFLTAQTCDFSYDSSGEYTIQSVYPANRVLEVQEYITHAQQKIPIMLIKPMSKDVYIHIILAQNVEASIEQNIKDTLVTTLMASTTVGQDLTTSMVLSALTDFASFSIVGATMGLSEDSLSYKTAIAKDVLLTYSPSNITLEMPGVVR